MTENRVDEIFQPSAEACANQLLSKNWEQQPSLVKGRGRV